MKDLNWFWSMQMTQNESFANTNGTEEKNICVDDERYIGCHQQRYLNIRIRVIPTPVVLLSARPLPLTSTCQKCPRIAFMNWGLIVMGVEIDVFLKLFSLTANRGLLNCSNSSYNFSSCQKEQAAGPYAQSGPWKYIPNFFDQSKSPKLNRVLGRKNQNSVLKFCALENIGEGL